MKDKIRQLTEKLNNASEAYYLYDSPIMPDSEFDILILELAELEKQYPQLALDNSPTKRIGGKVLNTFSPVTHMALLLSLSNLFSTAEVLAFIDKINQAVPVRPSYVAEWKIDGLTVSLEYIDGVFTRGATRGDGVVGEDITANLKTIKSIPKKISTTIHHLVVRGEAYLPKDDFVRLNQIREADGLATFANPRNAAAGSMRQLDPKVTAKRPLALFCYDIVYSDGDRLETQEESLEFLDKMGFPVNADRYLMSAGNEDGLIGFIDDAMERRHTLPYDVDGMVIKLNELTYGELVGYTKKAPKFNVALKFPPEEGETTLLDIKVGLGRTGVVTPLGILEPIFLSGSTISKVALHNFQYIVDKDLRIGDRVIVHKAGDVIPEIKESLPSKRVGTEVPYVRPTKCPSCGSELVKLGDEVAYRCMNISCPDRIKEEIIHFVSRDAMDIDGMGKAIVEKLLELRLVHNVSDIYGLTYDDLLKLPKIKEKSANNLLKSIEASKGRGLSRLLFGLGIHHVGLVTARIIAEYFGDMAGIKSYTVNNKDSTILSDIPNIGSIIAESFISFMKKEENMTIIDRLAQYGVKMTEDNKKQSAKLDGLSFCFTGTLPTLSRTEAGELARAHGAKVVASVSAKLDYLVAGEDAGSKLTKANSLNIKILTEDEFLELIN